MRGFMRGSALREIGFDNDMRPFEGSFLDWIFKQYLDPLIYATLVPKNGPAFRAEVKKYVFENWGDEIKL
jgi:hypothetical protein